MDIIRSGDTSTSSSTSRPNIPVVLFKTPSTGDTYSEILTTGGYEPIFVPVLHEQFTIDELRGIIEEEGIWEGIVISSRRGAEGWMRAAREVQGDGEVDWSKIPLWTVGTASREVIDQARKSLPPDLLPDRGSQQHQQSDGRTAKSAKDLIPLLRSAPPLNPLPPPHANSQVINTDSQEVSSQGHYRPYLIIRGDKSTDEIPNALIESGRVVRQVQVYETSPRGDIASTIPHTFQSINTGSSRNSPWLGFFSPSSARMVINHLPPGTLDHSRVFAIGETTRSYLREQGVNVDAVAQEPNATGMLEAMRRIDEDR